MRCARRCGPALLLALLVAAPLGAGAAEELRLDQVRRTALAALPALADGPADLEDRIVVLAFFASWCPPCHPEFDALKRVEARYRERGVRVLAVNIFESYLRDPAGRRLKAFLADKAPAFRVVGGGEAVAALFGGVDRIPTLFVFGRDGRPALHFVHRQGAAKTHADDRDITAAIEAVLQT